METNQSENQVSISDSQAIEEALNESTNPDFQVIRDQFPILRRNINGHPLVYLDSAASSQKRSPAEEF